MKRQRRLRDSEHHTNDKLERILNGWREQRDEREVIVTGDDILHIVSKWTGVPLNRMEQKEAQKLLKMEEELKQQVIGQDEAVIAISKALRRSRADLKDPRRPIGSFIFMGPTGVGTMPGTGLCRVTWHFPSNDRLFGPAYSGGPVEVISHSRGSEFTICALNDSVINFTCKVRGAHMRRPAQSPHRLVSSKTGRVRLHAVPGPVLSAVLCEA